MSPGAGDPGGVPRRSERPGRVIPDAHRSTAAGASVTGWLEQLADVWAFKAAGRAQTQGQRPGVRQEPPRAQGQDRRRTAGHINMTDTELEAALLDATEPGRHRSGAVGTGRHRRRPGPRGPRNAGQVLVRDPPEAAGDANDQLAALLQPIDRQDMANLRTGTGNALHLLSESGARVVVRWWFMHNPEGPSLVAVIPVRDANYSVLVAIAGVHSEWSDSQAGRGQNPAPFDPRC